MCSQYAAEMEEELFLAIKLLLTFTKKTKYNLAPLLPIASTIIAYMGFHNAVWMTGLAGISSLWWDFPNIIMQCTSTYTTSS